MTTDDDFTWLVERYLDEYEGSTPLPGRVRDAVRARLPATAQVTATAHVPVAPVASRLLPLGLTSRTLLAVAAAIAIAVVGIGAVLLRQSDPNVAAPSVAPLPTIDLGVFEPARGKIVVPVGDHLEAIDPLHPGSPVVLAPGDLPNVSQVQPSGWSADGSKLALSDESHPQRDQRLHVMDGTGALTRVPVETIPGGYGGCCLFVPDAWLSPDGNQALFGIHDPDPPGGPERLYLIDLENQARSRVIPLRPANEASDLRFPSGPVWSPDGTRAAYTGAVDVSNVVEGEATFDNWAVAVADLPTGDSRALTAGWGVIRQVNWSPTGSQLLMVASEDPLPKGRPVNPLANPLASSLYVIDVDSGQVREIADGHFMAAAWSPDGTQIAALDYPRLHHEVIVMNADGGAASRIWESGPIGDGFSNFTGISWNPAR